MKTLRDDISKEIGLFIKEDGWDDAFRAADIQGKMTSKAQKDILLILCRHVEELENGKDSSI